MSQKESYINFEEYSQVGEPQKAERAYAWSTAIGLQAVDGLTVSQYLKDTAVRNIEGEISIDEARELIKTYYQTKTSREPDDEEKQEADKVSGNIAKFLAEQSFSFSVPTTPDSCAITTLRKRNGCCVAIRYSMDGVKTCEWLWSMTWSKNDSSIIAD